MKTIHNPSFQKNGLTKHTLVESLRQHLGFLQLSFIVFSLRFYDMDSYRCTVDFAVHTFLTVEWASFNVFVQVQTTSLRNSGTGIGNPPSNDGSHVLYAANPSLRSFSRSRECIQYPMFKLITPTRQSSIPISHGVLVPEPHWYSFVLLY